MEKKETYFEGYEGLTNEEIEAARDALEHEEDAKWEDEVKSEFFKFLKGKNKKNTVDYSLNNSSDILELTEIEEKV